LGRKAAGAQAERICFLDAERQLEYGQRLRVEEFLADIFRTQVGRQPQGLHALGGNPLAMAYSLLQIPVAFMEGGLLRVETFGDAAIFSHQEEDRAYKRCAIVSAGIGADEGFTR